MTEALIPEASSASRQKSCHACVKGKRGCDKRYPTCSRCQEKNIQCVYAKRTYDQAFHDFDAVDLDMSWAEITALSSSNDYMGEIPTGSTTLDPSCLSTFDASSIDPFLDFTENQATSSNEMQLINNTVESSSQHKENEQALSKFDYSPMAELCKHYEPWQVYDPNTRVHFIVQSLRAHPRTLAIENSTPWLHRYLYKDNMPSSIRSCFTVCTLYSNMTSSNKTSVFRVLCENLKELSQQGAVHTLQEKLARTQALFLYQIIGLFDGDVTLRSGADRNMVLLRDWVDELCKIRENLELDDTNDLTLKQPRSREWWIFAESVRRTIIIAYAFLGLWVVMSKNDDDAFFGPWKYLHCFTVARPLWEAPSSFDFFQKWKTDRCQMVQNFDFEDFVKNGKAQDVDEFSKILLVTYMGLDETKQWFLDRNREF